MHGDASWKPTCNPSIRGDNRAHVIKKNKGGILGTDGLSGDGDRG